MLMHTCLEVSPQKIITNKQIKRLKRPKNASKSENEDKVKNVH